MLIPKKVKHRKWHKGRRRNVGNATRTTELSFGSYGIKSIDHHWINSRQIEAARRVITRYTKRGGKVWIRIFPDKPITKKGEQSVMGSGKGAVEYYVSIIKPGTVLFEMDGVPKEMAIEALKLASYKLPVKTIIITKQEQ